MIKRQHVRGGGGLQGRVIKRQYVKGWGGGRVDKETIR